jgi:hypothetical protein
MAKNQDEWTTDMASKISVLSTFAAIMASFALFSFGYCGANSAPVATAERSGKLVVSESRILLTERAWLSSTDENHWIEQGKRTDVGYMMALSLSQHDKSYLDRFVRHIQNSPTNVLLIDAISDKALATIRQMPRLRALVIHGSDVTDAGLKYFLKMPHLETVGFYYCEVTQEGVDRFRQLMPETRFEIYDSSRHGFVFDWNGCLATPFRQAYMKPSSWR